MRSRTTVALAGILCLALAFQMGCGLSNTWKGGAIGAGAGGAAGAVIGHQLGNTAYGAIIGAAVGGTAGTLIGRHMDKQAEEMAQDLQGAKIERVGEGIKITFDSGILFAFDSSELQSASRMNIEALAGVLQKYPDTNILVEGDTDSKGTAEYNQKLSERRADAVASYLKMLGVNSPRISTVGLGATNPVATNDTDEGRQQNRRVEIAVFANEKMKEAAKNGTLG